MLGSCVEIKLECTLFHFGPWRGLEGLIAARDMGILDLLALQQFSDGQELNAPISAPWRVVQAQ